MAVVAVVLSWYFLTSASNLLHNELEKKGIEVVHNLSYTTREGILTKNLFKELNPLIEATMCDKDIAYVAVVDKDGSVLAHSKPEETGKVYKDDLTKRAFLSKKPAYLKETQGIITIGAVVEIGEKGTTPLEMTQEMEQEEKGPIGVILIGVSLKNLHLKMNNILKVSLPITAWLIIIGLVFAFVFSTRLTNPIKSLMNISHLITSGNLDTRFKMVIPRCWKIEKCEKKNCPAYEKSDIPCWYIAETMCRGEVQGTYAKKIGDCQKCEVYKGYVGDELQQLGESFNVMTIALKEARSGLEEKISIATEDLKKTNIELKEKNYEIEAVNKELEAFTYSASHDLKEPLRGIQSFSQFILEDYADKLDDTGRDYLKRLSASANRMKSLIDDLLALSRISRVKNPVTCVDSKKLVKEVLKQIKPIIEEKNAKVEIDDELPFIYCDEVKIKQVFHNLILNAIKYNVQKSPNIEIGIEERLVDGISQSVFFVKDNGIGIEEKYFEEIFGIFKRLHQGNEYGGGTGAGLAIVKRVIIDHGGQIWVQSTHGQGSTFYFSLPGGKEEVRGER